MKKICFVITDAISFNTLCKGQLEYFDNSQKFDITLICGGDEKQIEILRSRNVGRVITMPLLRKPNIVQDIKCLFFIWKYLTIHRFDVIVYSTPKALLLGSLASFLSFQKNRIALVRGRVYENYTGKKRSIFRFIDKFNLKISHKVIFISKSLRDVYLNEKIISERKSILLGSGSSNGVDTKKFFPLPSEFCKDKFSIIMVGRICADKGINELYHLLYLIKSLPINFTLLGKVEDIESQKILDYLLNEYSFLNHVQHTTEPVKYFQQSDLHLFLSHREGFGNVALEAASCNIPTFAYNVVGVKDSVQHEITGLRFDFQDIESIAEAIAEAVKNPKTFKERFSKARTWAVENFEQKQVWENYLNFYKKVADGELEHD